MRFTFLITNCFYVCIVVTLGGDHRDNIRDRICDRVLPNNRIGRQDFLDNVSV